MAELFSQNNDQCDELGPFKIIHVQQAAIGLRAILVIDNIAKGPAIGGVRMAEDVSVEECMRLARAMTFKNAAAGLPFGGGKVVLYGDPKMDKELKSRLIRALAQALRNEDDYIFAPDMGTDEECMAWVRDEIARVVALPRELGGIPLDEIGATGFGLSQAVEVASQRMNLPIENARIAVQGFGAVGKHAARFLAKRGARIVAVADSSSSIHDADGLDIDQLLTLKENGKPVSDYPGSKALERDAIIDVPCDIWIPAARPDVIHSDNVERLNTRLVVEGANIPITHDAEERLHQRGIMVIPDFIANAGGVICAAMEYQGANQSSALQMIEEKLRRNTGIIFDKVQQEKILPRQAAQEMALERVRKAMGFRRFSSFSCAPRWL